MKNLEEYHNLYNQVHVLLLSDVFENFRNICCKHYNLDPAHCFTVPGLTWDAALKVTEVKLELLSDPDILLMLEKGIKGGVSTISNRYGKSNNSYMGDRYDASKPTKYITIPILIVIPLPFSRPFANFLACELVTAKISSPSN